ncbi:MAG: hypothetical protein V4731_03975 [Pseudomonadota bacterium]
MSQRDFLEMRSLIRWAGIGVLPSSERVQAACRVLAFEEESAELEVSHRLLSTVLGGSIPAISECRRAEAELSRLEQNPDEDDYQPRNGEPHG